MADFYRTILFLLLGTGGIGLGAFALWVLDSYLTRKAMIRSLEIQCKIEEVKRDARRNVLRSIAPPPSPQPPPMEDGCYKRPAAPCIFCRFFAVVILLWLVAFVSWTVYRGIRG